MRLSPEKVKEAILHPDQDVREAAVFYFADSFSTDPSVMPLAITAIEKYGFDHAFSSYSFMENLAQTDESIRWLMHQIKEAGQPASLDEAEPVFAYAAALANADPSILKPYQDEIMALELGDDVEEAVEQRIEFPDRTSDELWSELETFCDEQIDNESVPNEEFDHACRIVEALGRHREQFADYILEVLRGDTGDFDNWMEGFAVRLAGEMKLNAALPFLIEMLNDSDDWLLEECHRALTKIGNKAVVARLEDEFANGEWNFRLSVACILEDIHCDESVQACLNLLEFEEDEKIKGILLQSILLNFASEGIEPARQFILATPLDPDVLEVRTALLTACRMMGEAFPEFDAWLKDSANDVEFRKKWFDEHPLPEDDEDDEDDEYAEDGEDYSEEDNDLTGEGEENDLTGEGEELLEGFESEMMSPPLTFVRRQPPIGRNDPCPCGSGKKFKKCCYGTNKIQEETDLGHAAGMGRVAGRETPFRFPIGTVAFYGPDDRTTTKIVAGVIEEEGAEAIIERWVGTNLKNNPKIQSQMQQFFEAHSVKSIVATDGNIGCPHEEGEDFPVGEDCPFCPFWRGKQGSARRE